MKLILKEIRKKHNLTQQELAERLEVSRSTIAQVEAGNNSLSLELAKKIANAFNISLSSLLDENESDIVADIYKNDGDGYNNSIYMDHAQMLLIIDEIEIIKHSINEFAKEKDLKPRQAYFDRYSKQLDFENSKNIFQDTNHNKLSQKFVDDFCIVLKQCKNAILQDLANIISFHYNSIGFYYNKTD